MRLPLGRTHSARLVYGLVIAASALPLAACGSSGDKSAGAAQAASSVRSQQSNTQSSSQDNTQSSTQNGTQSSAHSSGGSISQSSFSSDEGTIHVYGGTSDTILTVDVDRASRLLWSNDRGRPFRLGGAGAPVDSTNGSGEVPLSAGHHRLTVRGSVWTVVIRPG